MANFPQLNAGETITSDDKINDVIAGVNGIGGTLLKTGQSYSNQDAPYDRRRDSGVSGIDFRWLYDAGVVAMQLNTGTEGTPTWASLFTIDLTLRTFSCGDAADTTGAEVRVYDGGADNKPGFLVLYTDGGSPRYLWLDTAGNLRLHTAKPADDDADGIILFSVGSANVPSSRLLTAGNGLTGGGDLSADRTFDVAVDNNTMEISADTLRMKDAGTTVAKLAAAVQDAIPNVAVSVGAEAANVIPVTLQLRDVANNSLAARYGAELWLSDAAFGAETGTAPDGGWAAGVGLLRRTDLANVAGRFLSDANGVIRVDVTHSAARTWYLMGEIGGFAYASAAVTFV